MEGAIAGVIRLATRRTVEPTGDRQLLAEIESVTQSIEMVSVRFDNSSDPDLVEECIYEMQALAARYRYLTREARKLGVTRSSLLSLKKMQ